MQHSVDPARSRWLAEGLAARGRTSTHHLVPGGFEAYARVLHRPGVRWIPGGRLPAPEDFVRLDDRAQADLVALTVEEPTTWADVADAFGTVLDPLAAYDAIVSAHGDASGGQAVTAPDGREFQAPAEGQLDADLLAAVLRHAVRSGSASGCVALWDGWGGLLTELGVPGGRNLLGPSGSTDPRHAEMLARSTSDPFNRPYGHKTLREGILSREVSDAPGVELGGRGYIVFAGDLTPLTRDDWEREVPWRDRVAEARGFPTGALSPSLVWPDDRSWIVATDVDADATVVGGPAALVDAVVADPAIEAVRLPRSV